MLGAYFVPDMFFGIPEIIKPNQYDEKAEQYDEKANDVKSDHYVCFDEVICEQNGRY